MELKADGEDGSFVLEQTLFHESSVWFYQVPRGQVTSLSPRADSWDPQNPFMTGSLQVIQKGDACWVQLYEPLATERVAETSTATRTLFAQCPLVITSDMPLDVHVQDCVDSSRYFMLRVEDEQTKRSAYVGIGFPERTSAFHFKACLQDYVKYVQRQIEVAALAAAAQSSSKESKDDSAPQVSNLKLPEGATIYVNLKNPSGESSEQTLRRRASSGTDNGPKKIPLIPPPPGTAVPLAATDPAPVSTVQTRDVSQTADEDDDWGEFTSA